MKWADMTVSQLTQIVHECYQVIFVNGWVGADEMMKLSHAKHQLEKRGYRLKESKDVMLVERG